MEIKRIAYLYMMLALFLGAIAPIMLGIGSKMNLYEFMFLVYALSVPATLAFVLLSGKKKTLVGYLTNKRDLAFLVVIGLILYAPLEFGLTYIEGFTNVSLATVIYRMQPLLMLIFMPIVLREKISKYQIAALGLGFIGIYFAVTGGTLNIFIGSNVITILTLVLISALGGLAFVLMKRHLYDMTSSMFIYAIANFALFGLLFAAHGVPLQPLTSSELLAILYIGAVYNVFVGLMYTNALRMLKTTIMTNVYFLSPFVTFVLSYLTLGEPVKPYYILIAVLVVVGLVIQEFDKKGSSYINKSKKENLDKMTLFDVTGIFSGTGEAAINAEISGGGRVLAVKLGDEYKRNVSNVLKGEGYSNVYTDNQRGIESETRFVKDIVGANSNEFVVMKAGRLEDCENFFDDLYSKIQK